MLSHAVTSDAPGGPAAQFEDDGSDSSKAFHEYRRTGDQELFGELVCRFLPLVRKIARRYVRPTIALEDLVQVGTIGLMSAVNTFDPGRNVKFEAYAYHYIAGEIRHYLRDDAEAVQVPRWARKLYGDMMAAVAQLQQELGRTPALAEIAARMNLTDKGVLEILRAYGATRVRSINDETEGAEIRRDVIAHQRYVSFQLPVEDRIVLMDAIERLQGLQRKIVYYLFFLDLTQSETAKRLGISQRHVSRLLAAALKRLSVLLHVTDADSA